MHKIIRTLILSDLFILGSFGLIQPIFAVFILRQIGDGTITSIGIALTIQLFTKATFQILVGKWDDEERGNKRESLTLLLGSLILSSIPIAYMMAHSMIQIYAIQFAYGLANALTYPSWRVIFSRYARSDRVGMEWGIYDTIISLAAAVAAAVGAYIADSYSFIYLFAVVSFLSFIGTGFIFYIFQQEFVDKPLRHNTRTHTHKKRNKL